MNSRINVRGVGFDNVTLKEAVGFAAAKIERREQCAVFTPNSEIVYECIRDKELNGLVNSAELVLPDGIGVIYAAKILGTPLKGKVAGIDFAQALAAHLAKRGGRLFLLGAKPGIAELAGEKLAERFPGLVICGVMDGYFKDDADAVRAVAESNADACFVCLGCPKQERFIADHIGEAGVPLMAGLGGSLDVFAGVSRRAPDIFIKLGLEWLYRLIKEPQRIGRMMRLPAFLIGTLFFRLFGGGNK